MKTQVEKGLAFRALHEREGAFILPNPHDAGTARLLEVLGFEAVATTSAGFAFTIARPDNGVTRESVMAHIAALAAATDLPLSADLENGFGDSPEMVAETIRMAAAAGAVGGSIEDATNRKDEPIYELAAAANRVRAAVEAAKSLPFPFMLTARAENYLHGRRDLKDTIARLRAFEEAGADVLFAPGITRREDIAAVVSSVDKPVNVIAVTGMELTVADLSALGVRRISVGSSLSRVAMGAFMRAAQEMREHGTFGFTREPLSYGELNAMFAEKR